MDLFATKSLGPARKKNRENHVSVISVCRKVPVLLSMSWKHTNILIKSTCCTYTIPLLCHPCTLHPIPQYFVIKSTMWFPALRWKCTEMMKHSEVHVSQLLNNIKGVLLNRYRLLSKSTLPVEIHFHVNNFLTTTHVHLYPPHHLEKLLCLEHCA